MGPVMTIVLACILASFTQSVRLIKRRGDASQVSHRDDAEQTLSCNDIYTIETTDPRGFFMNVEGNKKGDGEPAKIWGEVTESSKWKLCNNTIYNVNAKRFLNVRGNSIEDDAHAEIYDTSPSTRSSKWTFKRFGELYTIKNVNSRTWLAPRGSVDWEVQVGLYYESRLWRLNRQQ